MPSFPSRLFASLLLMAGSALGQETTPAPIGTPPAFPQSTVTINAVVSSTSTVTIHAVASPTFGVSPSPTPTPAATPSPAPSLLKKTGVKIQFLPPPMEGTISLGIYDHTGKLVRVLHRAATGDEFVAALDGYITHWDGLDDAGNPCPPGHYSARGYMVGDVTVRKAPALPPATSGSSPVPSVSATGGDLSGTGLALKFPNGKEWVPQSKIRVGLVSNPLDRDRAGSAELSVGFDAGGSWLQLSDGLPLKQISTTPNLKWAALDRSAPGEPLVVFQSDAASAVASGTAPATVSFAGANSSIEEYDITKVADMMAFDCGDFDFTGPSK